MTAQQMNVDVISNNLANVNTTGFKRSRVDFEDVLYQTDRVPGTQTAANATLPTGIQVGLGSRPNSVYKLFSQGTFQQTNNPFDLVVEGDGFFQIQMPDGTLAYTRDGAFKVDQDGRLVTASGLPLTPEIIIPPDALTFSVGQDGTVSVTVQGESQPRQLGQLELTRFVNPAGLMSNGRNLFVVTAASGNPMTDIPGQNGLGTITQGFIEMSNVKVVEEMVNMIVAMRAYEINSRSIQTSDEMLAIANNVRR
jgi:flagellar basal-body rod protein FlgG